MATKKNKSTKQSKKTLEDFKQGLASDHYNSVVGARRSAAYLPPGDKDKALQLIAKHFGVSADEPGEATRGSRSGGGRKKVAKKIAKRVADGHFRAGSKKVAKKVGRKRKAAPEEGSVEPTPEVAEVAAAPVVKKQRAPRGSKKAAALLAHQVVSGNGPLTQLGIIRNICGTVDQALNTIERTRSMGVVNIDPALQEVIETAGAAVKSIRQYIPSESTARNVATAALSASSGEEGVRPTNHVALEAAGAAAGLAPAQSAPVS